MRRKLLLAVVMFVALVGYLAGPASAVFVSTETFNITFTPTGDRGVMIATTTVALGNILPGSVNTFADAIPVTTTGTIASIEFNIRGAISGGAALTANGTATPAATEVQVQAKFKATGATFAAADNVDITDRGVEMGNFVDDNSYCHDLGLNVPTNLWMRLTLPATVTYSGVQTVTVYVTGRLSN